MYDGIENICVVQGMDFKRCILFLIGSFLLLTGCAVEKTDTKKINDIEFTVTAEEDIPKELKSQIEEAKESPFKITYGDKGYLYIAQGYGQQQTSGYSIEVTDLYETSNAIYIKTSLIGPAKDEKIQKKVTYPYVAVKIEFNEKHVVFE